ncbi:NUDIX hydrolase [Nostocoides sp. HKS02]|uniref:NUDIX hydrolase n=1 Tax=Nostocoides sp. HKS02 TaxID=1813880 RepID=UPI0012B46A90|nr:NUDIX domain-containing protein [Tetrasphaera sp. HKS02]QGN59262.1 NUDIX domain-containing protein [Tetrasphaera sp. HKS02]
MTQVSIRVHATTDGERVVASFLVGHGADPVRALGRLGWGSPRLVDAFLEDGGVLVLAYRVVPATPEAGVEGVVPTDADLVVEPGERARPYQRTAAYGVVTSKRGLLLTELSARTSAPGRWTLPGGGLDPGEEPVAALHREVWEESGQQIEGVRLLEAHTSHWIGRAPSGRLEDFHAVRIVYAAWCPAPTDPVVHDVGGSTESVRWVPFDEVERYPLGRSFAPHLRRWLEPPR